MIRIFRHSHGLALLLFSGMLAAAAGGEDHSALESTLTEDVIELHNRAVEGSEESVDAAIAVLEDLLSREPKNELARAYLGNVYTLKARDAALIRKRGWLNRGTETLDAAVERAPENPRVRLMRAVNSYNLPRMAERYELAAEDFSFLLNALAERPRDFDPSLTQAVYFHAGAFALREGDHERAVELLEQAAEFDDENEVARWIETMLRAARNRIGKP